MSAAAPMDAAAKLRKVDEIVDSLDNVYDQQNRERVKLDAKALLHNTKHLVPYATTYTSNFGVTTQILKIEGVIPTEFRGHTYMTPVRIFIPPGYPAEAPICYVIPGQDNADLIVSPDSPHVDPSGYISLDYLGHWNDQKNLIFLITEMRTAFSQHPPLRKRVAPPQRGASLSASSRPPRNLQPPREPARTNSRITDSLVGDDYVHVQVEKDPPRHASIGSSDRQFSDDPAEKREVKRRVNELLRKEMNSLLLKHRENIEKEQERQQELEGSNEKLQRHEERLASEIQGLDAYEQELRRVKGQMEQWIEENKDSSLDDMSLENTAQPADELTKQLFELVSEYSAIDDAFYWMGKAAERQTISMETFAEEARRRGRREFYCRTLAKKIHDTMEAEAPAVPMSAPQSRRSTENTEMAYYAATSSSQTRFAYGYDVSMG